MTNEQVKAIITSIIFGILYTGKNEELLPTIKLAGDITEQIAGNYTNMK